MDFFFYAAVLEVPCTAPTRSHFNHTSAAMSKKPVRGVSTNPHSESPKTTTPASSKPATNAGSLSPDEQFLVDNKGKNGVLSLASGMQYKVLVEGSGLKRPLRDSPCECHYLGTLIDGTQFDSSFERGKPSTFAPNQVIKGWTEAMQLMVEGDKWEMYIPYYLAYGENGKPPKIPARATLIFIMELCKIKGASAPVEDFPVWSADDLKLWTEKDISACGGWTDKKLAAYDGGDAKLKARFQDRAGIEAWTAAQSKKTQDQALWKRTRAARRPKYTSNAVADAPPASSSTRTPPSPFKMEAKTARAILDAALSTFKENKGMLTKVVDEIEAAPGDASSKSMQKMIRLLPKVQQLMAPALEAHGFKVDELMSVVMKIQACAADDPSIAADTMKLMKAAQGDISDLV